jgi:hypothetical protein
MQSAGQPNEGRETVARSPRAPAINRTLVWFTEEAEQRRRRAAAASDEAPARRMVTDFGPPGGTLSAEIYRRAQVRRAAYLKALLRRMVASSTVLPK